jgi:hypothetical protein
MFTLRLDNASERASDVGVPGFETDWASVLIWWGEHYGMRYDVDVSFC